MMIILTKLTNTLTEFHVTILKCLKKEWALLQKKQTHQKWDENSK